VLDRFPEMTSDLLARLGDGTARGGDSGRTMGDMK